jgi:hypothetical protein
MLTAARRQRALTLHRPQVLESAAPVDASDDERAPSREVA